MENLVLGDPMEPTTQVPPLAKQNLVDELHLQVEKSVLE